MTEIHKPMMYIYNNVVMHHPIPRMSFHYHINVIAYAGQNIKSMREARRTSA